jgi:hypothetical protein
VFVTLAPSAPVVLVKAGRECHVHPYVDTRATRSLKRWREYLDFVREVCLRPGAYVFNIAQPGTMKVHKRYRLLVPLLRARGWEVEEVRNAFVLRAPPEVFCSRERQLLLESP